MFEHFGLKDVFVGLWKYKIVWILVGVIACVGILGINLLEKNEAAQLKGGSPETEVVRYEASRVVSFVSNKQLDKDLVVAYKDITYSDECKKYVYDNLVNDMDLDQLRKLLDIEVLKNEQIDYNILDNYVSYDTLGNQIAARLKILTPNEQISELIRDLYCQYYMLSTEKSDTISTVFLTEGDTKLIHKVVEQTNKYSQIKGKVILLFGGLWFLSFAGIFVYVLFNPTLNRRSDFEEYGIEFIGEFPVKKIK